MTPRNGFIAVAALTVIVVGSWAVLRSPVPDIDPPAADLLSAEADRWCNESPNRAIPQPEWPVKVQKLRPRTVRVTSDGLYIERGSRFMESWGILVLRTGSTFEPAEGNDPSYRLLRGRVYWYEVKG